MSNGIQTLISLDYEIFFGSQTGSVEKCLIEPTQETVKILDRHNAKLSLFVDAGFLISLKSNGKKFPNLIKDYDRICKQLSELSKQGHDIQLHIHPHWEDCSYHAADGWNIDTTRYRLHDFQDEERTTIVAHYKSALEEISDHPVFAYRAGGWCIQPFQSIKDALLKNGIWLDSTVYMNGKSNDPTRWFDFTQCPEKASWSFSDSPVEEDSHGEFVEIPISSCSLSPLFYWKMALAKKIGGQTKKAFGDGYSMQANAGYYLSRLFKPSFSPVSLDGIKAGMLNGALKQHLKNHDKGIFNIMGHPKSLSRYSLISMDKFFKKHTKIQSITFQDLIHLKSGTN